ncbi:hypothetical protein ACYVVU_05445 [Arenicellales bacterium IMCC55707]|jgi:hypothetical protein
MKLKKIQYKHLNSKQKEIYNFQKVAAILADYGFNCIKLADDWQGADFLAYHKDGGQTLKVQLKGRLYVAKQYIGKEIYMTFPIEGDWYLVAHDKLLAIVGDRTPWLKSFSWIEGGAYGASKPSKALIQAVQSYRLMRGD